MKTQTTALILTSTFACGILLPAGCTNEDAASRDAAAQELIDEQASEYRHVALSSPELHTAPGAAGGESRQAYSALIGRIGSNPDLSDATAASAARIKASAQIDLALASIVEASRLYQNHRHERAVLRSRMSAGMRLAQRSTSHANYDDAGERRILGDAGERTSESLEQINASLAELEGPIESLKQQIAEQRERVNDLRSRAASLREQALSVGDLEGAQFIYDAVDLDRRADELEKRIALQEIELMRLQAGYDFADSRRESAEQAISSFETTREELDQNVSFHQDRARSIQTRLGALRDDIEAGLNQLQSEAQNDGGPTLAEALDLLDGAIQSADRAARAADRDARDAALLLKAQALELKARAYRTDASALGDHAALLSFGAQAGEEVVSSSITGSAGELSSLADQRSESANEAYQQAIEALEGLRMNNATIAALKTELAALAGSDMTFEAPPQTGNQTGNQAGDGAGQPGAASPEELVQLLNALMQTQDMASAQRMFDLIHVEPGTPLASTFDVLRDLMSAAANLDAALQSQFGVGMNEMSGQAGGMSPVPGDSMGFPAIAGGQATLDSVSGSTGQISAGGETTEIRQVGGRWYLVPDAADMGGDNPQQLELLTQMFSAFEAPMNQLADRVNAGEFSSVDQVRQAFNQMMQNMMGGGGGFGGGGNP